MRAALRSKGFGLLLLTLCVVGANSVLFFWSLDRLVDANAWVRHTLQARLLTQEVLTALVDAETGERGYLITSDPQYLGPYYSSFESARVKLESLRREVSDNPDQVRKLNLLHNLVTEKFTELSTVIQAHNEQGPEKSRQLVVEDHGRRIMDDIRGVLASMEQAEGQLLEQRLSTYEQAKLFTVIALIVFVATTLALVGAIFFMVRGELVRRAHASREQERHAHELAENVEELQQQRNDIASLNDASTFLQSCDDLNEVGRLTATLMSTLLPDRVGALYVFAASRNQLTTVT